MADSINNHRKIKAVIFDLDGVLVDTEVIYVKRVKEFFETYGITFPKQVLNSTVGLSLDIKWNTFKEYGPKEWDAKIFEKIYREYYASREFSYKEVINSDAHKVLKTLKGQGYIISLASSSSMSQLERAITECNLKSYFASILSGEMFVESKPNPEIYLKSAENIGFDPTECIVVEDSMHGIESGKEAGMKVIAKRERRFEIDQSKADYFINDLTEVISILEEINS